MKVTHVNFAGAFSGGERHTLSLIESLDESGVEQELVCRPGKPLAEEARKKGISVIEIRHPALGVLNRRWKQTDLINVHEGRGIHWGANVKRIWGPKLLVTRLVIFVPSQNWFTKNDYKAADHFVAVSNAVKTTLEDYRPGAEVTVIPHSFSRFTSTSGNASLIRNCFSGKFLVGQVAVLSSIKGHKTTLAAARSLLPNYPEIHFVICGDGPLMEPLKQQASDLPNVTFVGHQKDIGKYFEAFDLLVHPSQSEGLGFVMLEAQQHKTPVIASDVGGIPDIIKDGVTGLLIPPDDASSLEKSIVELYEDSELRYKIIENATVQLRNFSPENVAERYLNLYQQILAK
jgi:glycosyltransferase involved in cell wall biosynthesis